MKCIYTVIFNGYDKVHIPRFIEKDTDYILLTDNPELKSDFWDVRVIEVGGRKQSRHPKILPHEYLPEYDVWVYIDGNVELRKTTDIEFESDWMLKPHPTRNNVYSEGEAVIKRGVEARSIVNKQLNRYRKEGFNKKVLFENNFFIRKNTDAVKEVCENWWKEIQRGSYRDQLSLPYVLNTDYDLFNRPHTYLMRYGHILSNPRKSR